MQKMTEEELTEAIRNNADLREEEEREEEARYQEEDDDLQPGDAPIMVQVRRIFLGEGLPLGIEVSGTTDPETAIHTLRLGAAWVETAILRDVDAAETSLLVASKESSNPADQPDDGPMKDGSQA